MCVLLGSRKITFYIALLEVSGTGLPLSCRNILFSLSDIRTSFKRKLLPLSCLGALCSYEPRNLQSGRPILLSCTAKLKTASDKEISNPTLRTLITPLYTHMTERYITDSLNDGQTIKALMIFYQISTIIVIWLHRFFAIMVLHLCNYINFLHENFPANTPKELLYHHNKSLDIHRYYNHNLHVIQNSSNNQMRPQIISTKATEESLVSITPRV